MSEKEPIISTETSNTKLIKDHDVVVQELMQDMTSGRKKELLLLNRDGELGEDPVIVLPESISQTNKGSEDIENEPSTKTPEKNITKKQKLGFFAAMLAGAVLTIGAHNIGKPNQDQAARFNNELYKVTQEQLAEQGSVMTAPNSVETTSVLETLKPGESIDPKGLSVEEQKTLDKHWEQVGNRADSPVDHSVEK